VPVQDILAHVVCHPERTSTASVDAQHPLDNGLDDPSAAIEPTPDPRHPAAC
jgi:hypothetical protein